MGKLKEIRFVYAGSGISISEEGDNDFTAHISKTRKISIKQGKQFTPDNLRKIYQMADSGNMVFSMVTHLGILCLIPYADQQKNILTT